MIKRIIEFPYWHYVGLAAIVKLAVATQLPLTGDEAYFVIWGEHPAFGYYDHPPLTGWWLAVILWLFDPSVLGIRLTQLIASFLPALMVASVLRGDPNRQQIGVVCALFLPIVLLNVFTTTDTLYTVFSLLAMWLYVERREHCSIIRLLTIGGFLAAAFLSKYLAALVIFGIFVDQLVFGSNRLKNLMIMSIPLVLGVAFNGWWNYQNCGYNLLFNLVNRQSNAELNIIQPLIYLISLVYVLLPLWIFVGLRYNALFWPTDQITRRWLCVSGAPLIALLGVSLFKPIGLHWLTPCLVALMIGMVRILPKIEPSRTIQASIIGFGGVHTVLMLVVALFPIEHYIFDDERANKVQWYRHAPNLVEHLEHRYQGRPMIATPSYSRSAVLSFYADNYVSVFGEGSRYGRQNDLIHSPMRYTESDVLIVGSTRHEVEGYRDYFRSSHVEQISVEGLTAHVLVGSGFNMQAYRETIEDMILNDYYAIPPEWPIGSCAFIERVRTDGN